MMKLLLIDGREKHHKSYTKHIHNHLLFRLDFPDEKLMITNELSLSKQLVHIKRLILICYYQWFYFICAHHLIASNGICWKYSEDQILLC